MARKQGDFGMLGLTPEQEHSQEFVGIKKESNWERFKTSASRVQETIQSKYTNIRDTVKSWREYRPNIKLTTLGDLSPNQRRSTDRQAESATATTEQRQEVMQAEAAPQAIDTEAGIKEEAGEETAAETQKDVETLEEDVVETELENEVQTETDEEAQTEGVTAEQGEEKDETEQRVTEIADRAETALQKLEARLEQTTDKRDKLEQQIARLEALVTRIEALLEKMDGATEAKDNVVDFPEAREQKELKGNEAVAEAVERYGKQAIPNDHGRDWLVRKFDEEDGKEANNADAAIALGALQEYQDELEANGKRPNKLVEKAISHLEEKLEDSEDWKQPESQVSDWVEAQANINGLDRDQNKTARQLREVASTGDMSQMATAEDAISSLKSDRQLRAALSLEAGSRMNESLKVAAKRLNEKRRDNGEAETAMAA